MYDQSEDSIKLVVMIWQPSLSSNNIAVKFNSEPLRLEKQLHSN